MKLRHPIMLMAFGLVSGLAIADGGAVRVHNNASATITVTAEDGYGCTADPGDTCSFVTSVGAHHLTAQRHDTDKKREEEVDVPADGLDFNLADGNP